MTRRPKLNLTPEQQAAKKQQAGFKKREPRGEETMQETQQTQKPHVAGATATEPQIELPEAGGWDGKKLLKIALVVAAAGLSIYFLKRRFYP